MPTPATRRSTVLAAALAAAACGPILVAGDATGDASSAQSSGDADGTGASTSTSATSTGTSSTSSAASSDGETDAPQGSAFLVHPDAGHPAPECDIWGQDCPYGEKCMPWANDGGNSWNATKCTPIDANPVGVGEACMVEGSRASGVDDCRIGAMCWDVDPETNTGECVAFCMGSEAYPICEDPNSSCHLNSDGILILCLPNCNPLLQDCGDGLACYPVNDKFTCVPDAGGDEGAYGEPCEYLNVCDPGLFCANPGAVPNCEGASGCCTPFCDSGVDNASANCPGAAGGQECVPWDALGQAPPGYETVGACMIPQ